MVRTETTEARVARICKGDVEAIDFLCVWARYVHGIDDIVDGDTKEAEDIIATFALSATLLTHPFFLRTPTHAAALRQTFLSVANAYADSVAWEKSSIPWQRQQADCLRHCGNEMVFAVAQICGGYDHARTISLEHREIAYEAQHPELKEEKAA